MKQQKRLNGLSISEVRELIDKKNTRLIDLREGNEILKAPALIVKTLNGIGVNPAVKVMIRPYRSYLVFISRNTSSLNPGI